MILNLNRECKLHKACSMDALRPALTCVALDMYNKRLMATTGHILIVVKDVTWEYETGESTFTEETSNGKLILIPGKMIERYVKSKYNQLRIIKENQKIRIELKEWKKSDPMPYYISVYMPEEQFPMIDRVLDPPKELIKKGKIMEVGFDASKAYDLAQAMGYTGLRLIFHENYFKEGSSEPIIVQVSTDLSVEAILMPIRLADLEYK